jgi:5-methylcytosine-specific restriction endonuclease McrA
VKPYVKLYLDYYDLHGDDYIPCICGIPSIEIHHIEPKGMGGTAGKDVIENLIALCRMCHTKAHQGKISKDYLKAIVNGRIY